MERKMVHHLRECGKRSKDDEKLKVYCWGDLRMGEFWQTILIATIPSVITAFISYFAAAKEAKTQIKTIKEQNKADIEKIVEQNRVDTEAIKVKHCL